MKKEKTMKLDLAIMAGAESKTWLADLTKQIDRLDTLLNTAAGFTAGKADIIAESKRISKKSAKPVEPEEEETAEEDDEDDFAAKPKAKKKSAFDDDDEDEKEEAAEETDEDEKEVDEDDEDEEEAPPTPPKGKKAAAAPKPKKITVDDVNDACKARARAGGKNGRMEVLGLLKKKFKTESVSELEPEQWQACIDAMKVE